MITIYRSNQNQLEKLDQVAYGAWINVIDPTSDEIEELQKLGIPQDFITYPLDIDERSRTEREDDGTIFIILRIPILSGQKGRCAIHNRPSRHCSNKSVYHDNLPLAKRHHPEIYF